MQVNSAQDYLTQRKRQIVAATYHSTPPPQSRKHNHVFLSAMANNATQYQRFIIPTSTTGSGSKIGGATFTNLCCLSNAIGAPGTFNSVTDRGVVRNNVIPPIGVKATQPAV
jgi:hypothetical protein